MTKTTLQLAQKILAITVMAFICLPTLAFTQNKQPSNQAQKKLLLAYSQEIELLQAEMQALQKELKNLENKQKQAYSKRQKRIISLTDELLSLQGESSSVEQYNQKLETQGMESAANQDLLRTTLEQAQKTLQNNEVKLPEDTSDKNVLAITSIFNAANNLLKRYQQCYRKNETFYSPQGNEVQGKVLHIGQIAAYAKHKQTYGMLVPVAKDKFKLQISSQDLSELFKGTTISGVYPIFLQDPLADINQLSPKKDIEAMVKSGGLISYPIIALALLALLIVLERIYTLSRSKANVKKLFLGIEEHMKQGQWEKAINYLKRTPGSVSHVLQAALKHRNASHEVFETAIHEAVIKELPRLERFLSALNVIAAVAPLLGLLGTVSGMIATFEVITEHGTGNPKLLSGGISEALITTELGLILAIPVLLVHGLLSGWVDRIIAQIERSALSIETIIRRDYTKHNRRKDDRIAIQADDTSSLHPLDSPASSNNQLSDQNG